MPDSAALASLAAIASAAQERAAGATHPSPSAEAARPGRPSRFLGDLVRAMRAAADAERAQALAVVDEERDAAVARLEAAAAGRVEARRTAAATDVEAIHAWEEAELARVRAEAASRIEARGIQLERELDDDALEARARVAAIGRAVDAYREDLAAFHERLAAIEDPAAFAAVAAAMPAPPAFDTLVSGELPAVDLGVAESEAAEVALAEGMVAGVVRAAPPAPVVDAGVVTTRLVVTGLHSLAGIAAFKQSLARRPGIQSLTVTGNADGSFTYAVVHRGSVDVRALVASLAEFGADGTTGPAVEDEGGGTLRVRVSDAEAGTAA